MIRRWLLSIVLELEWTLGLGGMRGPVWRLIATTNPATGIPGADLG